MKTVTPGDGAGAMPEPTLLRIGYRNHGKASMSTEIDLPRTGIDRLAAVCTGQVLGPRDPGYTEACACWNLAWTQRPAIVVTAASQADVVAAVNHAAAHELGVAVQATGHGITVPADESTLLINTADLDEVRVDPESASAVFGAGVTWNPVLGAAQEHGLAPLLGSAPHVGAVGYTLGGGLGWLGRKYGLAVDQVQSLRVVLGDGRVVTASRSQEPELFWALCGAGGGSLGVVVEMTIGLAPVADVYAGNLYYPIDTARDVFDFYREWSATTPEEMMSAFNITAFPPLDLVPEPVRGQTFAIVRGCHVGGLEAGQELVDRWRRWREPLIDAWCPMPFARSAEISNDPVDPLPAGSTGRWLKSLDGEVFDAMFDAVVGGDGPSPMLFAEARQAGGAISRPNPAVCFASREVEHSLELVGLIVSPEADAELERRFASAWKRIAPQLAELPGYLNFTEGQERVQATQEAFGSADRDRLKAVKRQYDPADLFRSGVPLV